MVAAVHTGQAKIRGRRSQRQGSGLRIGTPRNAAGNQADPESDIETVHDRDAKLPIRPGKPFEPH
jgi:hypothetical protein